MLNALNAGQQISLIRQPQSAHQSQVLYGISVFCFRNGVKIQTRNHPINLYRQIDMCGCITRTTSCVGVEY